jgi:hypothetical protein
MKMEVFSTRQSSISPEPVEAPPFAKALMGAYHQATGFELTITYQRANTLTIIHEMGIVPQDITNVVRELKRLMRDKPKTYTETCLEWRNCMDPDTLEERVQVLRQRELRKRKPANIVGVERKVGSDVISYLEPEPQKEPQVADVRASLINLANNIKSA